MKENKLIPKRRFKEFENDGAWEKREFSNLIKDIADGPFGSNLKSIHYTENTEVRIIQLSNISESGWHDENVRYTTFKHAKKISRSIVESGDLVMAKMMPAGLTIVCPNIDKMYVLSSDAVKIKLIEEEVDSRYFVYMTKSDYFLNQINNDAQGSTRTRTSISKIKKMDIAVPYLSEQQKISAFFIELDNLITLHQRKLKKLKETKTAYLLEMFPEEGEKYPKRRFDGFTERWEERKLFEYAEFLRGNGLRKDDIAKDGQQECILYGNLYTEYGMITDVVVNKTNTQLKNPVYSKFGDVLIPASDTTPTGLARATSIEKSEVLLGGDINIVRPNIDVNGSCLSLAINANRKELIRLIKGTTVKHIHNSDIQYINISLPKSQDEQMKIVNFFKQLDKLITLHQQKLKKLENLKKAYLNEMFVYR